MQRAVHSAIFGVFVALASPALGDLRAARDLLDARQFAQAQALLLPAARAGNAEAEHMLGIVYGLGLGVARDEQRAAEWYLRAALKGFPAAQSSLGFYYETGRGLAAPDLVRAYVWYALADIGGDADAGASRDTVTGQMTAQQVTEARLLVEDYRIWLYPFK